jgi:hypothetical protein
METKYPASREPYIWGVPENMDTPSTVVVRVHAVCKNLHLKPTQTGPQPIDHWTPHAPVPGSSAGLESVSQKGVLNAHHFASCTSCSLFIASKSFSVHCSPFTVHSSPPIREAISGAKTAFKVSKIADPDLSLL